MRTQPPQKEPGHKARTPTRDSRVRYVKAEAEFELKCDACSSWWPITLEHWEPHRGLIRCRGCHNRARAWQERQRYATQRAFREKKKWQSAKYRRDAAEVINAKRRFYYWRKKAAA